MRVAGLDLGIASAALSVQDHEDDGVTLVDLFEALWSDPTKKHTDYKTARRGRITRASKTVRKSSLRSLLTPIGMYPSNQSRKQYLTGKHPALRTYKGDEKHGKYLKTGNIRAFINAAHYHEMPLETLGLIFEGLTGKRGFFEGDGQASKIMGLAASQLTAQLERYSMTSGQFLFQRPDLGEMKSFQPSRVKLGGDKTSTADDEEEESPKEDKAVKGKYTQNRSHVEQTFEVIWGTQQKFHSANILTPELKAEVKKLIIHQVINDGKLGFCRFHHQTGQKRMRAAHPLADRLRRRQVLRNISWVHISTETRTMLAHDTVRYNILWDALERNSIEVSALPALLELDPEHFKISASNSGGTKKIKGDAMISSTPSRGEAFKHLWLRSDLNEKSTIFECLEARNVEDREQALAKLYPDLSDEEIKSIAAQRSPMGTSALGEEATSKILTEFENDWAVSFAAATLLAGFYDENEDRTVYDFLPEYQEVLSAFINHRDPDADDRDERVGRITNPVVHKALQMTRKIVNAAIVRHGKADHYVYETTRELINAMKKKEIIAQQHKDEKAANDLRKSLGKHVGKTVDEARIRMVLRMRRNNDGNPVHNVVCPYCLKSMGCDTEVVVNQLFEMEHVIHKSVSFDNGLSNKVFAHKSCNEDKGARAPEQILNGDHLQKAEKIVEALYGASNGRKFRMGALSNIEDKRGDWPAHAGKETELINKLVGLYLRCLFPPKEAATRVRNVRSDIVAEVRRAGNLNALVNAEEKNVKDRKAQKHHALDAIVVGLCNPTFLFTLKGWLRIQNVPLITPELTRQIGLSLEGLVIYRETNKTKGKFYDDTITSVVRNAENQVLQKMKFDVIQPHFDSASIVGKKGTSSETVTARQAFDCAVRRFMAEGFDPQVFLLETNEDELKRANKAWKAIRSEVMDEFQVKHYHSFNRPVSEKSEKKKRDKLRAESGDDNVVVPPGKPRAKTSQVVVVSKQKGHDLGSIRVRQGRDHTGFSHVDVFRSGKTVTGKYVPLCEASKKPEKIEGSKYVRRIRAGDYYLLKGDKSPEVIRQIIDGNYQGPLTDDIVFVAGMSAAIDKIEVKHINRVRPRLQVALRTFVNNYIPLSKRKLFKDYQPSSWAG